MKSALITGCTGQDSSYLAESLLDKGYKVYGLARRVSVDTNERIQHLFRDSNFEVIEGDITDSGCIYNLIKTLKPAELYSLAAQSHVKTSFDQPQLTIDVNFKGVCNILEAVRLFSSKTKVYQASSSEMFGNNFSKDIINGEKYQDENTPFAPRSPYAVSKLASHNLVYTYRESYGLHASAGILFNHESPRRGEKFVTRKITKWLGQFWHWRSQYREFPLLYDKDFIYAKDTSEYFRKLRLGNIASRRDWGFAGDYVEGMWMMLQHNKPDDYVLATGETHSIEDFLQVAFDYLEIEDWRQYIVIDPKFYRPAEVVLLRGKYDKAKRILGWEPKTSFVELVHDMCDGDRFAKKSQTN